MRADAALGRWNPARGLRMRCRAGRGERELEWRAETRAEDGGLGSGKSANGRRTIEYRYAVIDEREHVIACTWGTLSWPTMMLPHDDG